VHPGPATFAASLALWRQSLAHCWVPSLLVALLWICAPAWLLRGVLLQQDPFAVLDSAQTVVGSPGFWLSMTGYATVSVLPLTALFACLAASAAGRVVPPLFGLAVALRRLPSALVAATLFTVATPAASFLFLVPGAVLWVMWQLWIVAMLEEGLGPVASLSRSWRLTARGAWWRAATLPTVVAIAAGFAWLLADGMASVMVALLAPDTRHALVYSLAVQCLLGAVLLSAVPASLVLLYRELHAGAAGGAGG
jgi:hypothetical protein